jgi:hypothetical protein
MTGSNRGVRARLPDVSPSAGRRTVRRRRVGLALEQPEGRLPPS